MGIISQPALALAAAYLRRSPIKLGRWRLLNYFLPILRTNGTALGEKAVRTRYGFRFKADLGDWLGQYVYLTGCYEPPTARVIAGLLNPGDTFIDVGANSGFFTLLASYRVGPGGHVLAFEPVPSMRSQLQANLSLNGVTNVMIYDVALSNTVGECPLHEGPIGHKGLSSLRPLDNAATTYSVKTMPLDNLVTSDVGVKLIKIDVEGAEQLVIDGMRQILEQQRPSVVIEVTDKYLAPFGHSAVELCHCLRNNALFTCKNLPASLL
jgi:FkbM family methyltransferase